MKKYNIAFDKDSPYSNHKVECAALHIDGGFMFFYAEDGDPVLVVKAELVNTVMPVRDKS